MAWSQVKGARGFTRLSGERAFVSRLFPIDVTRAGMFVISPVAWSRMEERLVGVGPLLCLFLEEADFKMDLRASLDFLMNMATRAEPHSL